MIDQDREKRSGMAWHFYISMVAILCGVFFSPTCAVMESEDGVAIEIIQNAIEEEIIIELEVTNIEIQENTTGNHPSTIIRIPGTNGLELADQPDLPVVSRFLQISDTLTPHIWIEPIESQSIKLTHPIALHPATPTTTLHQSPLPANPLISVASFRQPSGLTASWQFPDCEIQLGEPQIVRSIRIAQMTFCPVIWFPESNSVMVYRNVRIHIEMDGRDNRNTLTECPPITHSYDTFYRSIALNYLPEASQRAGEPESYLIVTPDSYESRLQGFIAWKEEEGFTVDILRSSSLPQFPVPADLKAAIQARYDGPNPPVYVLFCGDEFAFPVFYSLDDTHPGEEEYADDLYYSLLAGDDFYPDVFMSRLPAASAAELSVMLTKILKYELYPQLDHPAFYETALMAASTLEESQVTVKEQTRERMQEYMGYTTVHTVYAWSDDIISNMMDLIDDGVSIINYRGEGWRRGWNPEHLYWFDNYDVYELNNDNQTPFITSIGCGVCLFNDPDEDDCWGQAMMRHGTTRVPKGAVGVIGPTWNTHTTYNNWLDRGIYRGYVYWDVYRSGPMMNYGKMYMAENFPDPTHDVFLEQQFRTYLLFGTPDLWIRTSLPQEALVGIAYGNDSMSRYLAVRDGAGNKSDAAVVSWTVDDTRYVDPTDENGGILIDATSIQDETIGVVITGKNLIPLQTHLPLTRTSRSANILITEIKPDILTNGVTGDIVELFNNDAITVDLKDWILSDLDSLDTPFVDIPAELAPGKIAVIEFAGPLGVEEVNPVSYGLHIKSREIPDFSSLEGVVVLRDPAGRPVDSIAWHDNTGICSTNVAWDISRLTTPTTPFTMQSGGWWSGPDTIAPETYETFAINWSMFAGMEGPGSIQRISVGSPDSPSNFTVQAETDWGSY